MNDNRISNWYGFDQSKAVQEATQVCERGKYDLGAMMMEGIVTEPIIGCIMLLLCGKNPELLPVTCEVVKAELFLKGVAPFTEGARK